MYIKSLIAEAAGSKISISHPQTSERKKVESITILEIVLYYIKSYQTYTYICMYTC